MGLKITIANYVTSGGCVGIEDSVTEANVTLVSRRSPMSHNALRRLAVKRLRALADQVERQIYRVEK